MDHANINLHTGTNWLILLILLLLVVILQWLCGQPSTCQMRMWLYIKVKLGSWRHHVRRKRLQKYWFPLWKSPLDQNHIWCSNSSEWLWARERVMSIPLYCAQSIHMNGRKVEKRGAIEEIFQVKKTLTRSPLYQCFPDLYAPLNAGENGNNQKR